MTRDVTLCRRGRRGGRRPNSEMSLAHAERSDIAENGDFAAYRYA